VRLFPHCIWLRRRVASKVYSPVAIVGLILFTLTGLLVPRSYAAVHPVPLDKNVDAAKCLECHNSDDNREFGGAGPSGPHGSVNSHILERNYQFSQAAVPGGVVTNLFPNADLTVTGPYALCAKCHDLTQVVNNTQSFSAHALHISQYGFSCSVCHTAHGMGAASPTISGERLVNFDVHVVAQNGAVPISYQRASNTCTLLCHQAAHNADGTVTGASGGTKKIVGGSPVKK